MGYPRDPGIARREKRVIINTIVAGLSRAVFMAAVPVLRRPRQRQKPARSLLLYLWLKAFHVVAVIAWMAGMLYLPRLFVYHAEVEKGSVRSETFKIMERRLLKAIINPAMIATWALGLYLVFAGGWWKAGWFHGKFALVVILSGVHGFLARCVKDFAADRNTRPARFYRLLNEAPTVLMIGIVILVIVKPF